MHRILIATAAAAVMLCSASVATARVPDSDRATLTPATSIRAPFGPHQAVAADRADQRATALAHTARPVAHIPSLPASDDASSLSTPAAIVTVGLAALLALGGSGLLWLRHTRHARVPA